jgi:L-aspartate oxidase
VVVQVDGRLMEITGQSIILATGGIGGLYEVTTTPAELQGDGLALAALAGAQIGDPEFVQFHPTAIDIGRDPAPLATEALRGEGAKLINDKGEAFMAAYHPDAELAPRDVVARAIHAERAAGRGAFLDARQAVGDHFPEAFPAVFAACMSGGVDPRIQPIPVVPACHYHMGGMVTDSAGATTLPGLFAAGECASTGVHGANRLASNSLVEAAVFGARAGRAAAARGPAAPAKVLHRILLSVLPDGPLQDLRHAMSRDAGVLRDAEGLGRVLALIDRLETTYGPCGALISARLVAACALARQESRGGHYRKDYPDQILPARTLITLKGGVMESLAA